jgi:predicted  nucleic acid-binding Zn-ribbon protein
MSYFKNLSEEQSRLNLKSEKVELGLFDDLKKQISKLEKVLDEAKSQGKQGEKLRKEIVGLVKRLDKLANENKSTRKDGTSLARQMGLTREKILKDAKQLGFESQIRNNPDVKRSLDLVDKVDLVENQVDKIQITYISQ